MIPKTFLALTLLCSIHDARAQPAQAAPEDSKPISYRDIGQLYEIHGEFGKLYTDFTIKGTVREPSGKGDNANIVRINITHLRGQPLEQPRTVYVQVKSVLAPGSEVELVVREEAKLWYPEGIDDMLSSPDASHFNKLHCIVSLHERRLISHKPPGKK